MQPLHVHSQHQLTFHVLSLTSEAARQQPFSNIIPLSRVCKREQTQSRTWINLSHAKAFPPHTVFSDWPISLFTVCALFLIITWMYFYQTGFELLERQVRATEDGVSELRVIVYSLEKLMERKETADGSER
ncbi:hypothetical protein ABVK25_000873 [Lepraria finkii]|uniref:Uncharacterized protein n=1 Tax=Lepraria finkii TaxID=1340010 RepID=A0ABR4BPE0_9LECA